MRILLLHNFYQSSAPSGEDVAFQNDLELLRHAGHDVITFVRHNDSIDTSRLGRLHAAASMFWSQATYDELSGVMARTRPDIAHFHNTFPLISASGYQACRDRGVPVVQTLHNYRLICPNGLLLRQGRPCNDCVTQSLASSIRHACYRQSRVASGLVAAMLKTNRALGVYHRKVAAYLCLTEFARARFIEAGLPAQRLFVRPNALMDAPDPGVEDGGYALYVGRLSAEKGVETLLRAWQGIDYPLRIVGDGPLRTRLEALCRDLALDATFEGFRPRSEVHQRMRVATCLIVPSECYEGFPVTVLEGLASGTPMIVSALGGLDELLASPTNALKFRAGHIDDLRRSILSLLSDPNARAQMRIDNRQLFEGRYARDKALEAMQAVYLRVLSAEPIKAAHEDPNTSVSASAYE